MALQVWLPLNKSGADKNQGLANINITSTATYNASGKLGGSYDFSNSSNRISFPSQPWMAPNDTNSISIAMWVKAGSFNYIIACNAFEYKLSSSSFMWRLGNGGTNTFATVTSGITFTTGTWYHLCGTWDAENKKLAVYVNGELINEGTSTLTSYNNISSTINLVYNGSWNINDFRFYDHCLSPKEVKEISKGLVLHYPLNDIYNGSYNLLNDSDTFTNWGDYEAGYTEIKINEFGRKSLIITNKRSWCGAIHSVQIPSAGTYTISCYCKPISRTKTSIKQTLYISGNGLNDQSVEVDWNKTNQWQRLSLTRTYNQAGSFFVYLIAYGGSRTDDYKVTCEYTMPQVTKTDTTVPYVEKSIPDLTVYDCSGYQNNGTISGSLSCSADSPRYKVSTHFTSSIPSRINLPSDMSCLSGNNEQTLSCWVRSSGLGSGMSQSGLIALGYGNSLHLDGSGYCYRIDNGTNLSVIKAYQNPYDGNWHLVTATYKSGVASIYIDGILKNSVSRTFSNRYINNGGNCIGTEVNNSSVYNLNGDISDIRMYTTALSAEDIKELYNTSAYVLDNGTLLTYNVEE